MSMDYASARRVAEDYLQRMSAHSRVDLSLLDDALLALPQGWIFGYNSTAYLRTGNFLDMLGGNAPIFVFRDGSVRLVATAVPFEEAVQQVINEQERGVSPCPLEGIRPVNPS